jgi:hypothetical protein
MLDPLTIGLITTGVGALGGFLSGKAKEEEARRIEKMNREMSAADTLFNPLIKTKAYTQEVPDRGPGAFGGALTGALAGFNQAQMFNKSSGSQNAYEELLKKMQAGQAGQGAIR